MTKTIKLLTALTLFILISSFTNTDFSGDPVMYGVSDSDPSHIKLVINSDRSFYYQDFSNNAKKIIVNGNWTMKGKKMILNANSSSKKFHNVWTFEENGGIAKSRKGFCFYRLEKIRG